MGKAIIAVILTLFVWYLAISYGARINLPELGNLAAIVVMGGCIIYFNDKKNNS
ncbi:MAG: binding-protein-dependent transport permease [Tissierella sp.]|nr:binding-protein-dependent transport permease [Tissierella sp.]